MRLTEIQLFKNTPFTDFQNTIHFKNNDERDKFFDLHYQTYSFSTMFDFVKDRLNLKLTLDTSQTYGINYMRFKNNFENDQWYYCFVMGTTYINDHVTEFQLIVDVMTTFMQGDFSKYLTNTYVNRQSLTTTAFNKHYRWLMTNQDALTFPKVYTHQAASKWSEFVIVFQCSADLSSDFGYEKDPKLILSEGQVYDGITSPVNLYVCEEIEDFNHLMKILKDYPWISQNINNVAMIPVEVFDLDNLEDIPSPKQAEIATFVKKFKNNKFTKSLEVGGVGADKDSIKTYFGLPAGTPDWVFRGEYASIEMTGWNGQSVNIEYAFLPDNGLKIMAQSVFGYHNEIRTFPDQYKSKDENSVIGLYRGAYINNGIVFDVFDDIPVQVDNYKLSKANSAHQRELSNDRTVGGRIRKIKSPNTSLSDKFFNAVSLTTSLTGGALKNGLAMYGDEYEHYRDQNAQLADLAISAPSVGSQNNSQSFNISAGIFGVSLKYNSITSTYAKQVMLYHNTFGFDFDGQIVDVESVESMPYMNFIKLTGNFNIPNVPAQFVQQLKITLENGVKLWHNHDEDNPFKHDLTDNWVG